MSTKLILWRSKRVTREIKQMTIIKWIIVSILLSQQCLYNNSRPLKTKFATKVSVLIGCICLLATEFLKSKRYHNRKKRCSYFKKT